MQLKLRESPKWNSFLTGHKEFRHPTRVNPYMAESAMFAVFLA